MRSLKGNIVYYERRTPPPNTYLWAQSFYIPNGVCVFRYSFYGKDSTWLYATRRGASFELETTRGESPTLYGTVCRAVASRGGGPGDRWQNIKSHDRMWRRWARPNPTYVTQHLRYEMPSGYQHREAHGGNTQRGHRSLSAYQRRLIAWKESKSQNRRVFRQWKSSVKDAALRVHGGPNPKPLIHPRPTYEERFIKSAKSQPHNSYSTQVHNMRSANDRCTVPIPTNTDLCLWTWNVEGLRETAKYDSIISYCRSQNVSLLCAQETKAESCHYFNKNGWQILMSGLPSEKHHGVGFFVSPWLRSHVSDFIPHSPRIAEVTVNTVPRKITILNVYAPSWVEDPDNDRDRKQKFWSQLGDIALFHSDQSHLLILGDLTLDWIPKLTHFATILVLMLWEHVPQSLMTTGAMPLCSLSSCSPII